MLITTSAASCPTHLSREASECNKCQLKMEQLVLFCPRRTWKLRGLEHSCRCQISGQLLSNHDIPRPHDRPSKRCQFCQVRLCARFRSISFARLRLPASGFARFLSPRFHFASSGFTWYRLVSLSFVWVRWFCYVSQCPWFRLVSLVFVSCQQDSLGFVHFRPEFARLCRPVSPVRPVSLGFVWFRMVSHGFAWFRMVLSRLRSVPFGFAMIHLVSDGFIWLGLYSPGLALCRLVSPGVLLGPCVLSPPVCFSESLDRDTTLWAPTSCNVAPLNKTENSDFRQ